MSEILPDLPGYVHGIKALDPPTIQCDGCGYMFVRPGKLSLAIILCHIVFNPRLRDGRRMCGECWAKDPA